MKVASALHCQINTASQKTTVVLKSTVTVMRNKEGNQYFIGNTLNIDTMKVLSEIHDNAEECSKLATIWDQTKRNFNNVLKEA